MDKLDEFKQFVKSKPNFISLVQKGDYSWQQLYEMYVLYGENHKIWQQLDKKENSISTIDLLNIIKDIDIDTLILGMQSLEKLLDIFANYLENGRYT